eukprot:comp19830_c0_seq1/m.38414 comp19830_c0_seq1/g.38414  ORF comp19830_c0_seq1/g.38414 comp19830_c0_seq1/m.38414 type:complete len:564 (+) comp19830_c0_seq1:263-1954(+)
MRFEIQREVLERTFLGTFVRKGRSRLGNKRQTLRQHPRNNLLKIPVDGQIVQKGVFGRTHGNLVRKMKTVVQPRRTHKLLQGIPVTHRKQPPIIRNSTQLNIPRRDQIIPTQLRTRKRHGTVAIQLKVRTRPRNLGLKMLGKRCRKLAADIPLRISKELLALLRPAHMIVEPAVVDNILSRRPFVQIKLLLGHLGQRHRTVPPKVALKLLNLSRKNAQLMHTRRRIPRHCIHIVLAATHNRPHCRNSLGPDLPLGIRPRKHNKIVALLRIEPPHLVARRRKRLVPQTRNRIRIVTNKELSRKPTPLLRNRHLLVTFFFFGNNRIPILVLLRVVKIIVRRRNRTKSTSLLAIHGFLGIASAAAADSTAPAVLGKINRLSSLQLDPRSLHARLKLHPAATHPVQHLALADVQIEHLVGNNPVALKHIHLDLAHREPIENPPALHASLRRNHIRKRTQGILVGNTEPTMQEIVPNPHRKLSVRLDHLLKHRPHRQHNHPKLIRKLARKRALPTLWRTNNNKPRAHTRRTRAHIVRIPHRIPQKLLALRLAPAEINVLAILNRELDG